MELWPWSELGLPGPTELEAVKAAYGQRLRELHPEEDPEGFQRLYRAYQAARQLAAEQAFPPAGAKAEPGAADCPHAQGATDWDFEQLLSQGEREAGPEGPFPEEPFAWAPPHSRPRPHRPAARWFCWMVLLALLIGGYLLVNYLREPSPAVQAMGWLEEDFGVELVSSPQNPEREEPRYLYWLKEDPDLRFQAICQGERTGPGSGYRTNYTLAQFYRAMREFSQAWPDCPLWFDLEMTDSLGEGASGGAPPSLYLFQAPLEDTEAFLRALGAQLEQLAREDWYQTLPPEYQLILAHGNAVLYSYSSTEGGVLSGQELLDACSQQAGLALLQDLVLQQGVGQWDFASLEEMAFARYGYVTMAEAPCWWVTCYGWGLSGEHLAMNYYLRQDLTAVYCIPEGQVPQGEEVLDLTCTETLKLDCGRRLEVYRVV